MAGSVAGAAGKGALGGASTGAALGSVVPGVGTAIGAAAGAVIGGVASGVKANKAKQADEAINAQDPQELARLAEINRIRKSIGAGTDALTQQGIKAAQQTGATTQGRIARNTGGDVGATIAGFNRAQSGTQAATNQAVLGAHQRLPFFENMGQQLSTRISQRALEVGLLKRDQAMAEKAADQKAASANIAGGMAMMGNRGGGVDTSGGAGIGGVADGGMFQSTPEAKGFINDPSLDPSTETFVDDSGDSPISQSTPSAAPGTGPQMWTPNATTPGPFDNFNAGNVQPQAQASPFSGFNTATLQASQAKSPPFQGTGTGDFGVGFDPKSSVDVDLSSQQAPRRQSVNDIMQQNFINASRQQAFLDSQKAEKDRMMNSAYGGAPESRDGYPGI